MTYSCLFHEAFRIIYDNCNNYFDWLIFVTKELPCPREAVFYCLASRMLYFSILWISVQSNLVVHGENAWNVVACMPTVGYLCMQLYFCAIQWQAQMYNFVYAHCCLQHPLIYKQIRYCNIYSIIKLADFQFKFYVRERGHSFLFFYGGGSPFFTILFTNFATRKLLKVLSANPET